MLHPETPFPYPGSYALHIDTDLSPDQQAAELVRIMWRREGHVAVSFPLRLNASGNKAIAEAELIDATPLSPEEERIFHDLDRLLAGRSPATVRRSTRLKKQAAIRDALLQRVIWAPHLTRLLREMRSREAMRRAA